MTCFNTSKLLTGVKQLKDSIQNMVSNSLQIYIYYYTNRFSTIYFLISVPVQLLTSSTTPEPTTSSNAVGHLDNHGCTLGNSTFYPDGAQVSPPNY